MGNSRGATTAAVSIAFVVLSSLTVAIRLITRISILRHAGPEDWSILLAAVSSVLLTVFTVQEVQYGMGRKFAELEPEERTNFFQAFWTSILLYNFVLLFTKSSIILQYVRIFPSKKMRTICWVMFGVVVVYSAWTIMSAIFTCYPIANFWDPVNHPGSCINKFAMWFANAGINIATDIAIIALPMPALKSLNLPKRQKIAVMGIFGLGAFVCVVSILRLPFLYQGARSTDITHDNPGPAMWSCIEVNVGIICASLPAFRACISRIFPSFFSTNHETSVNNRYGSGPMSGSRRLPGSTVGKGDLDYNMRSFGNRSEMDSKIRPGPKANIHGSAVAGSFSSDEENKIGLGGHRDEDDKAIKVVTVVSQAVERRDGDARSETGSENELVTGTHGRWRK